MTNTDAPTAAYLTDASLSALAGELRGASGKLRAEIKPAGAAITADSVPSGGTLTVADGATYVLTAADVINWIVVGA